MSRRHLLGLAGAGLAGVAAGGWVTWRLNDTERAAGHPGVGTVPTTARPTTTADPPPDTTTSTTEAASDLVLVPYEPVEGEVFVEAKVVACRVVEELMHYEPDEPRGDLVGRAMAFAAPEADAVALEAGAAALFVGGARSVPRVVYPQLGGLHPHADPTTGSVMVVVDQRLVGGDGPSTVSRCVDVRVRRVDGQWRLTSIEDTSGPPVMPTLEVTDPARRVLQHPDIDMPDSVRWDIYEGIVDERILGEMAELADRTPIAVTTCMRGHPVNVFGTSGRSAHNVGRAVDIWALGHVPVVQQREDETSVAYTVAERLFAERRIQRLGAPWAFDPPGGWSWTDPVHKDHLHLGVSA